MIPSLAHEHSRGSSVRSRMICAILVFVMNELETNVRCPPKRRAPAAEPASESSFEAMQTRFGDSAGDHATLTSVSDEARRILEAAMRLPDSERAALATVLKDSVSDGASLDEIEAAWIAEAERRREDLRAGRTTAVPWQDVRREMFDMVARAAECTRSVDADIAAGSVYMHGEVRATVPAHLGGAAEDRSTLTNVNDNASRILDAALQLPDAERAQLAAILTDSIGDGSSPEEVRASWLAEIKRRRDALARGEETLVDFDDVMARLRAKVRRSRERRTSTG